MPLLGTLGVICLLAGLTVGYAERAIFNSNQFAARAASTLENPDVRREIAVLVTDEVVISAEADLVAFRPLIEGIADQLVGSSAFRSLFRSSVADLHRAIFTNDQQTVTLTVLNLGVILRAALERVAPEAAEKVPADLDLLTEEPPQSLVALAQMAEDVRALALILLVLALVAIVAALWLSPNRREAIRRGSIGLAVGASLMLVSLWVLRTRLIGTIDDAVLEAALDGVWRAYLSDFRDLLLVIAGSAAVVAAAAAALLRPLGLERPISALLELLSRRPERTLWRVLRALGFILAGALIVADTDTALKLAALAVGIGFIYLGAQELLRLVVVPEESGAEPAARRRLISRNGALVSGICALAIIAAGSVFIATGGVYQAEAEPPGCNGHPELCERTLPEVVFPATHNSFSAADQENWLFAQHEAGIAAQLQGGVRAFLIDTHWGQRTADGSVITDLSADNKSRQQYVDEFGAEVVDAALRVRDSFKAGSGSADPPEIYLCHGFCEVGARRLQDDLVAMRDFLVANPNQVLVVIVQNEGVEPDDFAAAVDQAGLTSLVYRGSVTEWPTLEEMIRDNQRLVFMSENPPFGVVDWNHEAYAITQETPYSFHNPSELTNPKKIPASCVENRGPADAPLFLLNHWIDTSPAPRPSNARIVNAYDVLLNRARECERLRGQKVNLVAVDFWRTGDLFAVVDTLNGVD